MGARCFHLPDELAELLVIEIHFFEVVELALGLHSLELLGGHFMVALQVFVAEVLELVGVGHFTDLLVVFPELLDGLHYLDMQAYKGY